MSNKDRIQKSCDYLFKEACERGVKDGNNNWYRDNVEKCSVLSECFFDKYFEELVSLSSEERAVEFKEMGLDSGIIEKLESIFKYEEIDAFRFFRYIGLEESEVQHWEMNWLQKLGKFVWNNKGF